MNNIDQYLIANIAINAIVLAIYLYLGARQSIEVVRPKSWLTPLRWRVWIMFTLALLTLIPNIVYQISQLNGLEWEGLHTVVLITSPVNRLISALAILEFVHYKVKEGKE